MQDFEPEKYSDIPLLKIPIFESDLPGYISSKLSDQERWLYESTSQMNQRLSYITDVVVDMNREQRKTNGNVRVLKHWRKDIEQRIKEIEGTQEEMIPTTRRVEKVFFGWKGLTLVGGVIVSVSMMVAAILKAIQIVLGWH